LDTAGYRVAFDDRDSQGSLTFWANQVGKLPLFRNGDVPDVILCDTPGRLDLSQDSTRSMLQPLVAESDRLIVISEKSLFSTHATVPMVEFVKKYKTPESKAAILFNKVRLVTTTGKQDRSDLAQELGLPALMNDLPLAAPFENVQTMGFAAVTGKHRELVLTLALEILK